MRDACPYCGEPVAGAEAVLDDGARAHGACAERWLGMTPQRLVAPMLADAAAAGVRLGLDNAGGLVIEAPERAPAWPVRELREWEWAIAAVLPAIGR